MTIVPSADTVFAPTNADGSPRNVSVADTYAWATQIERAANGMTSGGIIVVTSAADLADHLDLAPDMLAWVWGSSTPGEDGQYRKIGASGSGSFVRFADLPTPIIPLTLTGGTTAALAATSSLSVPETDRVALLSFIAATDSVDGGTTIAINGATAIDVVDAIGNPIVAGSWYAGQIVPGWLVGGNYQLLIPVYAVDRQLAARTDYADDAAFLAAVSPGGFGLVTGNLKRNDAGVATDVTDDELARLYGLINAEVAARETAISTEQSAREAADGMLTTAVSDEAATRSDADDALAVAIAGEATARENADAELLALINSQADLVFRDTDAFMSVELDDAGYAGRVENNRGTDAFETAYVDAAGYAGHIDVAGGGSLDWTQFRNTDAFSTITVDAAGYAIDGESADGSPLVSTDMSIPEEVRSGGSTGLLLLYGQSPFTGPDTTAISTSAIPGVKTFDAGYANLVDLVMSTVENGTRGAAEAYLQAFADAAGYDYLDDHTQLVCSIGAVGGMSAWALRDGGDYFPNLTTKIDALAAIAASTGETVGTLPLIYCQGEADINPLFDPTARHRIMEELIRKPLEAYATAAFGYPVKIIMVLTQVASHQYYGHDEAVIAESDYELCMTNPNYKWGGTMYQFDYGAGGVGSHLLTGADVKHAAAYTGRAAALVSLQLEPPMIRKKRGWVAASNIVMLEYEVPKPPLVIDTTTVIDPGSKGVQIYRTDTMAELAIAAVEIVNRRFVKATMVDALPSSDLLARHAWSGGAVGVAAGRQTGSRGCIRDSDPAVFDPTGLATPLHNWMPIHSILIKR